MGDGRGCRAGACNAMPYRFYFKYNGKITKDFKEDIDRIRYELLTGYIWDLKYNLVWITVQYVYRKVMEFKQRRSISASYRQKASDENNG